MPRRIFSVGFSFPGNAGEYIPFRSNQSLLDADIIVFQPRTGYYSSRRHQGKPLLDDTDSFEIQENASYWNSQLKIAFDAGKTTFVFLSKLEEFYVHTGQTETSGTGRSRAITQIVRSFNNYTAIPLTLKQIVPSRGSEIRVCRELKVLLPYWKEFADCSVYEVYLEGEIGETILITKTGDKAVGTVVRGKGKKGTMILLPPIQYDSVEFVRYDEEKDAEVWTSEAIAFGKRLAACLIEADRAFRSSREATPPPQWTKDSVYHFEKEVSIRQEIEATSTQIQTLQNTLDELTFQLGEEGKLRWLLYEKGDLLEQAMLEALRLIGFEAEQYKESESEFDAVFVSPEGRCLGEAEGKDNRAINIDKLSQLERNLQEDFAREEVAEYAKGVLFGNAYRLTPLSDRGDFFTKKCTSGAKRSGVALVCTPDLFRVAKYLKECEASAFAKKCREAIMGTEGEIVQFPQLPQKVAGKG